MTISRPYMALSRARRGPKLDGDGVRLPCFRLAEVEETDGPTWIQVAEEGQYLGHSSGAFTFDRAAFEQMVANFRAHPTYLRDPGKTKVIPFDFHHASTKHPADVAVAGAPAQSWAMDLEVRDGDDGKVQLWALTFWLEPARTYVRELRYQWTSVVAWPNAVDPVSGENIGWYVSSIAFTNDPFIQGMVPIAAAYIHDPWEKPTTRDELLDCFRRVFELPAMATEQDISEQLVKLSGMLSGAAPDAVNVDELVSALRAVLNLPTLTAPAEVVAEAAKALNVQQPVPVGPPLERRSTMDFLLKLARMLGVSAAVVEASRNEKDGEARAALEFEIEKAIGRTKIECNRLAEAMKSVMSLAGVEDPDAAVEKLTSLMSDLTNLQSLMPELEELKAEKKKMEDEEEEGTVEEVMASYSLPEVMRDDLRRSYKELGRIKFAEKHGLPKRGEAIYTQALLTRPGVQLSQELRGRGQPVVADANRIQPGGGATRDREDAAAILAAPGRNIIERAMAHVKTQHQDVTYEQQHELACRRVNELRRSGALPMDSQVS